MRKRTMAILVTGLLAFSVASYSQTSTGSSAGQAAAPTAKKKTASKSAASTAAAKPDTTAPAAQSQAALNAYQRWGDALVAKYGEDAVDNNHVPDALGDVAAKAFGPIRPTTVRVGQRLIPTPG